MALLMLALSALAAPGCVQEERNRQEMMHQRIVTLNRADVMVMTGDLPEPHQTLGEIKIQRAVLRRGDRDRSH